MLKLFTETPKLLMNEHIVYFSEKFHTGEVARYAGNFYKVTNPQQVSYDRYYILPGTGNDYLDVDLSNAASGTENLYPHAENELYEVLFGYSGKALIYPIIPAPDRHFAKLGYTGMLPDVTNATRMYLGCYKNHDTPYETPKLRMMFVKDLDALILRTRVDAPVNPTAANVNSYEKIVFGFLINRCSITKITPNPEQASRARKILHYSELKKGTD